MLKDKMNSFLEMFPCCLSKFAFHSTQVSDLIKDYRIIGTQCDNDFRMLCSTVKPVNKGHPEERQNMVFIDKWSLFGVYIVLFNQERVIEMCEIYLQVVIIWRWPLTQI